MAEINYDARFQGIMLNEAARDIELHEIVAWHLSRTLDDPTEEEIMYHVAEYYRLGPDSSETIIRIQENLCWDEYEQA